MEYFRFYYATSLFFFAEKWLTPLLVGRAYLSIRPRFLSGVVAVFDCSTWLAGYADAKTLRDRRRNTDGNRTMP